VAEHAPHAPADGPGTATDQVVGCDHQGQQAWQARYHNEPDSDHQQLHDGHIFRG
jgi:hypothetical protein